ncbi:MAG: hypothetical protein JNJ44_09580 [Zoogloeaceae bacterium]|nr:hypothetical protein [Zoogloeaceae bacterium]
MAQQPRRPAQWLVALLTLVAAGLGWLGSDGARLPRIGSLPACLGESEPMKVSSQMPYVRVAVGGATGEFVLDFGADVSSITPAAFDGPAKPVPVRGTSDHYADFRFFGPWGTVRLLPAAVAVQGSVRQAGVLGTDFLSRHAYTIDYRGGRVHRATRAGFCSPAELSGAGFHALSTVGYYSEQPAALTCPATGGHGTCPNIPSLPVQIGPIRAIAQLDTGFDDGQTPHSVNINEALLFALRRAGVELVSRPDLALHLSTCQAGVSEAVEAYQLSAAQSISFVEEGGGIRRYGADQVTLFVKRTPAAAAVCGGIGTWAQPAAQLGASFFARGVLVVDPFGARVWFRDS